MHDGKTNFLNLCAIDFLSEAGGFFIKINKILLLNYEQKSAKKK